MRDIDGSDSFTETSEIKPILIMLKITLLSFLLFTIVSYVVAEEVEKYSDKYDYVDVDEILANKRLREQYYDCFMDIGPCITPDAKFFREFLPETFQTQCRKCTDKQKIMFDKVAGFYTANFPAKWDAVVKKFLIDPSQNKNKESE